MLTEDVEDFLHAPPLLAAGVEFAIRVGSGSPLAKTVVALRVNALFSGDEREVAVSLLHAFASLDDDGAQAQFYELESGKQSAGTCSDDNRLRPIRYLRIVYR